MKIFNLKFLFFVFKGVGLISNFLSFGGIMPIATFQNFRPIDCIINYKLCIVKKEHE